MENKNIDYKKCMLDYIKETNYTKKEISLARKIIVDCVPNYYLKHDRILVEDLEQIIDEWQEEIIVEKKIMQEFFLAKLNDEKNWELRKEDDVIFEPGMQIKYWEINSKGKRTGRYIVAVVLYVLHGPFAGLEPGYCIYSDQVLYNGDVID